MKKIEIRTLEKWLVNSSHFILTHEGIEDLIAETCREQAKDGFICTAMTHIDNSIFFVFTKTTEQ